MQLEIAQHISCANWIPTKLSISEIVATLNLQNLVECTFEEGLQKVHTNYRQENPNAILISPTIASWNLIMGCQLQDVELANDFTTKLSKIEGQSFALGIDIWCGYYFWMYSVDGKLMRYYLFDDGEIEEVGQKNLADECIRDCNHDECVMKLSKTFGLDMDLISTDDLGKKAFIASFSRE